MESQDEKKLDNPVWHSLQETHEKFSLVYDKLRCYQPEFGPFGGYETGGNISGGIREYAKRIGNFFIVGEKPSVTGGLTLKNELVIFQMVLEGKIDLEIQEEITSLEDNGEVQRLVNMVQPGDYFKSRTIELGDYYGIYKNGNLIAVTGERMKMNSFTEVSAVVTHPDHAGRGYAKQLIAHVVNKIVDQDKIPYLHVVTNNIPAIRLYEKLGFKTRRKISFWNFIG